MLILEDKEEYLPLGESRWLERIREGGRGRDGGVSRDVGGAASNFWALVGVSHLYSRIYGPSSGPALPQGRVMVEVHLSSPPSHPHPKKLTPTQKRHGRHHSRHHHFVQLAQA